MLFRNHLRFKGYWLSFLAWLTLSFAAPLSTAVAADDGLWLRMCAAHGVQWVQLSVSAANPSANSSHCTCLAVAIPPVSGLPDFSISFYTEPRIGAVQEAQFVLAHPDFQPRSPPALA